jgi:hypothetical protein
MIYLVRATLEKFGMNVGNKVLYKERRPNFVQVRRTQRTHAVAQSVEALRYMSEGRGFDSRWCHSNYSLALSLIKHYGPGVDSVSNRTEYQEYFLGGKGCRCLGLTTLSPSCADCLEIWEPQPPGTLRACPGL